MLKIVFLKRFCKIFRLIKAVTSDYAWRWPRGSVTWGIQQENEICIILRRYIVIMNNSIRFYRFVLLKIHKTLNSEGGFAFFVIQLLRITVRDKYIYAYAFRRIKFFRH